MNRVCNRCHAGRQAYLFGFPFDLVEKVKNRAKQEIEIGVSSISYPSPMLAFEEWPKVAADVAADVQAPRRNIDVFMKYDASQEMRLVGVKTRKIHNRLPSPKGASGGGIWQGTGPRKWHVSGPRKTIWHVGKVKLIAIQSAWDKDRKYIRGVQIRHWIELIARDYPDLRKQLSEF